MTIAAKYFKYNKTMTCCNHKILSFLFAFLLLASCKQEKLLFYPEVLPADYQFEFNREYREYNIEVDDETTLNGLLFKAPQSKGLIFYLHGNAGSIRSWGIIADVYTKNQYDFFILDYRGYGKSQGKISSEKQLYSDIQTVYDTLKHSYSENNIVIIGYSIGTGLAAHLASKNSPRLLILKAPYYNMVDLAHQHIQLMPSFLIKYKLRTDQFITNTLCPIVIFHGNKDEVIHVSSSYKLKPLLKKDDRLIILEGQGHNGMNDNDIFKKELANALKHL